MDKLEEIRFLVFALRNETVPAPDHTDPDAVRFAWDRLVELVGDDSGSK